MMWIDPTNVVDKETWAEALDCMRSRPGMGSVVLMWDPYRCEWDFRIDYADRTTHAGRHGDINEAIRIAIAKWKAAGPREET